MEALDATPGLLRAARVFDGPAVGLSEVLAAREARAAAQTELLAGMGAGEALLSATLRVPGPVKTSAVLEEVFARVCRAACEAVGASRVVRRRQLGGPTGPELLLVVRLEPLELKRRMMALERAHPLGALVDLDVVVAADGRPRPVSRAELGAPGRPCLVCGGPAKPCARSRAHGVDELRRAITTIIEEGGIACG